MPEIPCRTKVSAFRKGETFGFGNLPCHSFDLCPADDNSLTQLSLLLKDQAILDLGSKGTLKSLCVPGGILLLVAVALLSGGLLPISASAVDFYYYAVFAAGILLAWRFHSSRTLFALVVLLLAHRALEFFSGGRAVATGPGRIAFEAIAVLVPVNFIVLALRRERGLSIPAITPRLVLLFLESVFVAVLCRPGETTSPAFLHLAFLSRTLFHWTKIPQLAVLVFLGAFAILLVRIFLYRKPVEIGLLWSLAATFLALQANAVNRIAVAYWATAGLLLVASIIENTYVLAYHDELTSLPGRRAFNEALLRLEAPYAMAVVDIDHFKSFNDTYGHDTGDQVLSLVASRLARVSGGGQAFRVGGEEFSILFAGKPVKEVAPYLDALRATIEQSSFRVRSTPERRSAPRGAGRRSEDKRSTRRKLGRPRNPPPETALSGLSVTVSIGVAESDVKTREAEQVVQAADKALYRAKKSGRNRVEIASEPRSRTPRLKRNIA
ncbi:MAG: GGDEF domain-containing protein [Terriglobales bacterium]